MPRHREFVLRVDDQPPQQVDPENEDVLHVEFRAIFTTLAQEIAT